MSRLRRDRFQRKLTRLLEIADDEAFFLMVWATRAIQSGRRQEAAHLLIYPPEAATTDLSSPYAIHPWKLETLLNELLVTRKLPPTPGKRQLNCQHFAAVVAVSNALRDLENAHDAIVLEKSNVLLEMNRLTQRQFEWQRGFVNYPQFYRAAFLYGGPLANNFISDRYGFSVPEFMQAGFLLRALFQSHAVVTREIPTEQIGLRRQTFNTILDLVSRSLSVAREETEKLRAEPGHVSYKRSLFRQFPCISFGTREDRFIAPLADLITLRTSNGIFYEIVNGGPLVKKEAADRFEQYSRNLLEAWLPSSTILPQRKYFIRKDDIETPDIRVIGNNGERIVLECKARRMSYQARFGENPFIDAEGAYGEIARGVFQIWRYVSHARQGLVPGEALSGTVSGIVLTLDSWLTMADPLREQVIAKARETAAKHPDILLIDQIPVLFCSIDDLERTLAAAPDTNFFDVISATRLSDYKNWMLSGVAEKVVPKDIARDFYPFEDRMAEVLPWWTMFAKNE